MILRRVGRFIRRVHPFHGEGAKGPSREGLFHGLIAVAQHIGLKEATDQVDAYLRFQPVLKKKMEQAQADTRAVLLRWLVFLLAGGAVPAYFLM